MIVKAPDVWFLGWRRMMISLHIKSLWFIFKAYYYFVHFIVRHILGHFQKCFDNLVTSSPWFFNMMTHGLFGSMLRRDFYRGTVKYTWKEEQLEIQKGRASEKASRSRSNSNKDLCRNPKACIKKTCHYLRRTYQW
jgi:hypothetical protein